MRLSRVVWYYKLDIKWNNANPKWVHKLKATKKLNECTCTQKIGKEWNFERLSQVATLQEEEVVTLQEKEETALHAGGEGGDHRGGKQLLWQPGRGTWPLARSNIRFVHDQILWIGIATLNETTCQIDINPWSNNYNLRFRLLFCQGLLWKYNASPTFRFNLILER